ncbi:MAG: beta-ketoacyl-[acyl-carrier-protein] synthase family protein [Pelovirga sp.]
MTCSVPIAVTGLGCLSGAGMNLDENLVTLFAGRRYPGPPIRFSTDHPVAYPVLELRDEFKLPLDEEQLVYARTGQLALAAAREALNDAGYDDESLQGKRVGVCVGTTVGCALNCDDFYRDYKDGSNPGMAIIERYLRSNPAAVIARQLKLNGPVQTVVNACSSGTDAIGLGASWLRSGACDLVISGGADELSRVTYAGFSSLMITDTGPCSPFDVSRKGLNLGEGAAIMILEPADATEKKRVRGLIRGYGSACDAHHLTAPRPDGAGLKTALNEALQTAGVTPQQISFVNAHGTGTPDNDRIEGRVLRELLPQVPFLSTKGYTGHTLGAAGAIEAVYSLACLERGEIPASIGFSEPDPEIALIPVIENTPLAGRVALSQSLAFGGNNAVLILSAGGV